jgi:hypothetical protein
MVFPNSNMMLGVNMGDAPAVCMTNYSIGVANSNPQYPGPADDHSVPRALSPGVVRASGAVNVPYPPGVARAGGASGGERAVFPWCRARRRRLWR